MDLNDTAPTTTFIAERPYAALQQRHAKVYDALIRRFKPLPLHLNVEDYHSLSESGSFLINQGVLVEILECEFESEENPVFLIDIAFEEDVHGLTDLSDGGAQKYRLILQADDFLDAVLGVAYVMTAAR